jgi:hypothetical protein
MNLTSLKIILGNKLIMEKITKIIHQTGPSDKTKWHPLWESCSNSWKEQFSDWEYRFWNDDDIDNLIKEHYSEFWNMYNEFPAHIMKIDFVRFAIMHKYGGIYADLDYFCYQNFESDLLKTKNGALVENPYGNDPIENSLMYSEPNHEFFYHCMTETQNRWNEVKRNNPDLINNVSIISKNPEYGRLLRPYLVFYISGTNLISSVYRNYSDIISTLPGEFYNNNDISYDPSYKARHIHTGLWGKENMEKLDGQDKALRNIPVEEFDFYFDYSFGKYKNYPGVDWSKNDVVSVPKLNTAFAYS